jgi:hypothetical protein
MKVQQIYSNFGWLHLGKLMQKYDLKKVNDINKPCLFFGCYGNTQILKALSFADHSPIIIWWSGGDMRHFKNQPDLIKEMKLRTNITHVATVNFIERNLVELNIPYKKVPLFSHPINNFSVSQLGNSIYIYKPKSNIYCPVGIYERIKSEFKNIPFIEAQSHLQYTQSELMEIYRRSFLAIRLTKHDGLAHTACEIGLMGKKIIWNGDTPNAIGYQNEDDILIQIENVVKEKYNTFVIAKKMYDYLNVGEDWLNV